MSTCPICPAPDSPDHLAAHLADQQCPTCSAPVGDMRAHLLTHLRWTYRLKIAWKLAYLVALIIVITRMGWWPWSSW